MAVSAITVANRFFDLAQADGRKLTPLQLMKLVYIAHGWNLGLFHRPLINEQVEAWKYGPVISNLYQLVKHYGSGPITEPLEGLLFLPEDAVEVLDQYESDIVQDTYDIYGTRSGLSLSALTHQLNTPWDMTVRAFGLNSDIPNDLIEEHYTHLADERNSK